MYWTLLEKTWLFWRIKQYYLISTEAISCHCSTCVYSYHWSKLVWIGQLTLQPHQVVFVVQTMHSVINNGKSHCGFTLFCFYLSILACFFREFLFCFVFFPCFLHVRNKTYQSIKKQNKTKHKQNQIIWGLQTWTRRCSWGWYALLSMTVWHLADS